MKAQEPPRAQRLAPDREEIAERRRTVESDDSGGVTRPRMRAAARAAHADARGDDDCVALAEQLEVDTAELSGGRGARRVHRRSRPVLGAWPDRRRYKHALQAIAVVGLLAGCGGGSSSPSITVGAARTYQLQGFTPAQPARAGKPTRVSFTILQPNGKPLTQFRRGAGPHTGVHLIIVRRDLAVIVHQHPPVGPDGRISETITFPAPGPYHVVIDVYPKTAGPVPNFQLFTTLSVAGAYVPRPLPVFRTTDIVDGYRFTLHGRPHMRAIVPAFLDFSVTTPSGAPARFTTWFGALAHAIFFRRGTLDYFHTHVCAPGATGCSSILGASRVTGTSATPGRLKVGVLVPIAGTWRLFLQCRVDGHILTAPFTLHVG